MAGYEDLNDAERLSQDPTFRLIGSEKIWERGAALPSRLKKLADMTSHSPEAHSSLQLSLWAGLLFTLAATQVGCSRAASQQAVASLELKSSSFSGDTIPRTSSSCDHQEGASPELSWSAPPEHTQSFVLIVFDKDSPPAIQGNSNNQSIRSRSRSVGSHVTERTEHGCWTHASKRWNDSKL